MPKLVILNEKKIKLMLKEAVLTYSA